ncbi:M15 family peptidase [Sulfitobacter sp. BDSS02]|nr:M15 family peptidase [Sulfitobacter sp. BDSS02]MBR9850171.1 M15 family metallopeptidase [Paracoccaceae bacterium]
MRLLPAIIVAVAVILAPVLWVGLTWFLSEEDFQGSAVDSGARIEIEVLRQQVEDLQSRMETLENEVARLPAGNSGGGFTSDADAEDALLRGTGPNDIIDAYAQVVLIANRTEVNRGLEVAGSDYLEATLGRPRDVLSDTCEPMTNENLRSKLVLTEVGPIRVNMLQPAVDSLRRVFANVERADPDLYARINTSGSLCVRRIRGTTNRLSTHSYGLAVDLNIDGQLDNFTDGKTQLGLTILADFFHAEGWVWGAGFRREDSMHFEISRRQLDEWLAEGLL